MLWAARHAHFDCEGRARTQLPNDNGTTSRSQATPQPTPRDCATRRAPPPARPTVRAARPPAPLRLHVPGRKGLASPPLGRLALPPLRRRSTALRVARAALPLRRGPPAPPACLLLARVVGNCMRSGRPVGRSDVRGLVGRSGARALGQSVGRSVVKSLGWTVNRWVGRSADGQAGPSLRRSVRRAVGRSVDFWFLVSDAAMSAAIARASFKKTQGNCRIEELLCQASLLGEPCDAPSFRPTLRLRRARLRR